jgi:hypothetical protein
VLGGGVVACAALSDLGSYSNCTDDCDASGSTARDDATNVVPADDAMQPVQTDDQSLPEETGPVGDDGEGGEDAGESPDGTTTEDHDSGHDEVEAAAPVDAGTDVGTTAEAGPAHDSGATGDGGCASTNSTHNCGACGVACDTTTGTPTCNGVSCGYMCATNKIDCNFASAPDTDGCECAGTACCGNVCETAHASGIPSPANYYNCSATGNSTLIEATAVCLGVGGGGCTAQTATCPLFTGVMTSAVCGTVANTCYCWVYSGTNSGTVSSVPFGPCNIPCQSGTAWN